VEGKQVSKRALVTGGAGFIGSHMIDRLLADGYEVTTIDNLSTGQKENVPDGARLIVGDVSDRDQIAKAFDPVPDVVFHIAGQASTIRSFNDPMDDIRVNVHGTVNTILECIDKKVPRLLYASSMTSYGHPDVLPVTESAPISPVSYYGITKLAAERYAHSTADRNDLDFDFNVTSFRMFNVYGPRQSLDNPYQGVVAIFISNIMRNLPCVIHSDGEQSRDFVEISDVVDAWMAARDNPKAHGKVFNLGTGSRISVNQLVDAVLAAYGKTRDGYDISYQSVRPGDQRHMEADITLAKTILGWSPKVGFEEGMARTVLWAQEKENAR
jgi:UDP-glucose 4-epimerase